MSAVQSKTMDVLIWFCKVKEKLSVMYASRMCIDLQVERIISIEKGIEHIVYNPCSEIIIGYLMAKLEECQYTLEERTLPHPILPQATHSIGTNSVMLL